MRASRTSLVAGMLCVVAVGALASIARADDGSFTVLVRFYPAPGERPSSRRVCRS